MGVAVGNAVYVTGPKVSGILQVDVADPSSSTSMPAVGVVISKPTTTTCVVQGMGPVASIYGSLTAGSVYVVGTDGNPATVGDANYPGTLDEKQQLGVASDTGELELIPLSSALDASGGGISEGEHELLDTLTHSLAEDAFTEYGYTAGDLTSVIVWTSAAKTLKIRETALSYTGGNLTGVVVDQYNDSGVIVTTLTKTFAYNAADDLESITVVRS